MKGLTETSENRIAYVNADGHQVIFDRKGRCAACKKCLLGRHGCCPAGGPFNQNLERDFSAWVPV